MSDLWERLAANDNRAWSTSFLGTLADTRRLNRTAIDGQDLDPDSEELAERLSNARHVHFFIDYDGTLVPVADKPELATPTPEVIELLRDMVGIQNFRVSVVSGRDRRFLEEYLIKDVTIVAEHGACIRYAGTDECEHMVDDTVLKDLWGNVLRVMMDFEKRIPGSRIEKKEFGVVWHYRMAEPIFAQEQARELAEALGGLLQRTPLGVTTAKKAVEVRHIGVNKGDAVRSILQADGFDPRLDVLITIGDDRTDEDMFKVYTKDNISIGVSDAPMSAAYLISQPELIELLEALTRSAKGWQYKLWDQEAV
jgi:trehalose 6-phosphate synthase/phosphatase